MKTRRIIEAAALALVAMLAVSVAACGTSGGNRANQTAEIESTIRSELQEQLQDAEPERFHVAVAKVAGVNLRVAERHEGDESETARDA